MSPADARDACPPAGEAPLDTGELRMWVARLAHLDDAGDDSGRIDQLRALEEVKSACAAAQARVTVAFKRSQLAAQEAAGVPARHRGRGIGAQVALARRESAHRGGRLVGLAEALVNEMPHTLSALERGATNEWRATILTRETACLTLEDRVGVDAEVGPRLDGMGDREVETAARRAAYRADPHAFVKHSARAAEDRTVTTRPAPDVMCRLSALLPVAAGVAAYAALKHHADSLKGTGDPRTFSQIMADTLVERVTGQAAASPAPITLNVLISDDALLRGGDEPAQLIGYGPVPAPLARDLVTTPEARVFLRRLYTRPDEGRIVAMDARTRLFPETLRHLLVLRDQICRTPYCGAPIRHADHVTPYASGGATSEANGQGLCAACNHAKQAPGWRGEPAAQGAGTHVTLTTPTGHTYHSTPPPPPGPRSGPRPHPRPHPRPRRKPRRAGRLRVVFVDVSRAPSTVEAQLGHLLADTA